MAIQKGKRRTRHALRDRRHKRIRKKIEGTPQRPRLVVFRSSKNIEGQLIDDASGQTLLGLSTLDESLRGFHPEGSNRKVEHARAAGKLLAERAQAKGIEAVVFDRGGFQFHGRVKAFAEGAREGGLRF